MSSDEPLPPTTYPCRVLDLAAGRQDALSGLHLPDGKSYDHRSTTGNVQTVRSEKLVMLDH
eukprot:622302-Amphidinium_carterae.1